MDGKIPIHFTKKYLLSTGKGHKYEVIQRENVTEALLYKRYVAGILPIWVVITDKRVDNRAYFRRGIIISFSEINPKPILLKKLIWFSARAKSGTSIIENADSKWRSTYRKAKKLSSDFLIYRSEYTVDISKRLSILGIYNFDDDLLSRMRDNLVVFLAQDASGLIHGVVIFYIDMGIATYYYGWSSDLGRKRNINYLLIVEGLESLSSSVEYFDLGGLSINGNLGINRFKKRLNFEEYILYPKIAIKLL